MEEIDPNILAIHTEAIADPEDEIQELKQSKDPYSFNFYEIQRTSRNEYA